MASLSIFLPEGVAEGCATIYPIGRVDLREGAMLTFEVLEVDASRCLKRLIGEFEQFGFESRVFYGELLSLQPCGATVLVLSILGKPAMHGVLRIHKMLNAADCSRRN